MKVHLIACGGSAMHNFAIALHLKGYQVTGSDDEIFEPSKGRLAKYGLLPENIGWNADKITSDLDAVILGMHARKDNPELLKAQELGLKIYSYPEYLYEQTKDKTRVVIGGSHGKTSVTSMILHALNYHKIPNDYMVGAQLEGFECMVKMSDDAEIAILEGDEYLSSPIDRRPKFHLYKPDIALLSGIAWDHINVFPTFENYVEQFNIFCSHVQEDGTLIYYNGDKNIATAQAHAPKTATRKPYAAFPYRIEEGKTILETENGDIPLEIFGDHNLQNLHGALLVCEALGMKRSDFYAAIQSFKGASKRLELVKETPTNIFYKDFAHSPSKLKATTQALKAQYPNRKLIACMELHTFSSLNKDFLPLYDGAMNAADEAYVYFSHEVVAHKKLPAISAEEVLKCFGGENVTVFTNSDKMVDKLKAQKWENTNLLLMSSGNFDGVDFVELGEELFVP